MGLVHLLKEPGAPRAAQERLCGRTCFGQADGWSPRASVLQPWRGRAPRPVSASPSATSSCSGPRPAAKPQLRLPAKAQFFRLEGLKVKRGQELLGLPSLPSGPAFPLLGHMSPARAARVRSHSLCPGGGFGRSRNPLFLAFCLKDGCSVFQSCVFVSNICGQRGPRTHRTAVERRVGHTEQRGPETDSPSQGRARWARPRTVPRAVVPDT